MIRKNIADYLAGLGAQWTLESREAHLMETRTAESEWAGILGAAALRLANLIHPDIKTV